MVGRRRTPFRGILALAVAWIVAPLQAIPSIVFGGDIDWRGQRLRVARGGKFTVVE
jgi:hypothetical protein